MKKPWSFTFFALGLLLIGLLDIGVAQPWDKGVAEQSNGFAEVAIGDGNVTWKSGDKLQINAVAVFLRKDGEAEIWLLSGKQNVYAGGRWCRGGSETRSVDLVFTDDTKGGSAIGYGTVFLQQGCVPVARVKMNMKMSDGIAFAAEFVTKNSRPCEVP